MRRVTTPAADRADLLLVCSPGGHLLQMVALRPAWEGFSRAWVTLDSSDGRSLLDGEVVVYANGPAHRSVTNLLRNLRVAWRVVGCVRPNAIVTTGAALAVPFALVGRMRRIPVVYVESFTRVERPSLSLRLVKPFASRIYVQWPELAESVPGARYVGNVFALR